MSDKYTPPGFQNGRSVIPQTNGVASQPNAMPMGSIAGPGQHQGFDIWGPLQRRKYLIALFCLIGAGLGYLYYVKTPKVYASSIQLMISVQAPPTVIDGSFQVEKVSLSKHSSLLTSEAVMKKALDAGEFGGLDTFRETSNIIDSLRFKMIDVDSNTDETLTLTCSGPVPAELPQILNQVVASYKEIIEEDSQNIGDETIKLVDQLASNLKSEKQSAEVRWLELRTKLGITSLDENGNVANPFNKRLFGLQDQLAEISMQLRDVRDRLITLEPLKQVDPAAGEVGTYDPVLIKVVALEAQEYLKLNSAVFRERNGDLGFQSEFKKQSMFEERIWDLDQKISQLELDRAKLSNVFASGHKRIVAIDKEITVTEKLRSDIENELTELKRFISDSISKADGSAELGDTLETEAGAETFRDKERQDWIAMYDWKLQNENNRLGARIDEIESDMKSVETAAGNVSRGIVELNMLQRQIDKKDAEINSILKQLSEMTIMAKNYTMTSVRELDTPRRGSKIAPSLPKSLALGTMLAFFAGLGLAILIDQSELSYRSPHEILERLKIPVVGRIPRINTRNVDAKIGHASLIAAHKPASTASESFRDVRTGLFFRSNLEDIKTVLFSSPSPGDGKSTTIANMAISIAQAGKRVILVDADFRRPRVHQYFDEEIKPGLLDVLSGEMNLRDTIRPSRLQDNLYLLTSGGRPANPGELVTSEAFRELIGALRERFDYVLIDSPPVLPVSDPATIASMVDAVYLVTRIRKGVKLTAQKAKDTLDSVGANWMGIIVNGIDENPHYSEYGYQYGNYSYYGGMYGKYYDSHHKAYREKISVNAELKT